MPEYMSIKDVAEYLNVEYKTVYRLVRQGEIPAAKVGGVYRIHSGDVESYLQQQMRQVAPEQQVTEPEVELMKCGVCYRLLHDDHEVGGLCSTADCDVTICSTCWREGHRQCSIHRPSRVEQFQQAKRRLETGELPRLVAALEARQREQNYIRRFDTKVQRITKVWHPLRNQIISPTQPWSQLHQTSDKMVTLMQLLHTGFLEEGIEQGMPINAATRYHLPGQGEQELGLVLEARVFSHMEAFVERGFDTEPATLAELNALLDEIQRDAEGFDAAYLVGLASPTGWTEAAQAYVATGETGSTFHHRLVLPCLVDLTALNVIYNPDDERLRPLVPLFAPRLPEEEIARVIEHVKHALVLSSGVSIQDVHLETGIEEPLIRQAFGKLVSQGAHRLEELPGVGPVIVRTS